MQASEGCPPEPRAGLHGSRATQRHRLPRPLRPFDDYSTVLMTAAAGQWPVYTGATVPAAASHWADGEPGQTGAVSCSVGPFPDNADGRQDRNQAAGAELQRRNIGLPPTGSLQLSTE